jgi:hypothetical protein
MSNLNIEFLKAQMTALQEGMKTEEQVCQAIEAEVCEGIFHDRQEMEKEHVTSMIQEDKHESLLHDHFENLLKQYTTHIESDDEPEEDTTNEY